MDATLRNWTGPPTRRRSEISRKYFHKSAHTLGQAGRQAGKLVVVKVLVILVEVANVAVVVVVMVVMVVVLSRTITSAPL